MSLLCWSIVSGGIMEAEDWSVGNAWDGMSGPESYPWFLWSVFEIFFTPALAMEKWHGHWKSPWPLKKCAHGIHDHWVLCHRQWKTFASTWKGRASLHLCHITDILFPDAPFPTCSCAREVLSAGVALPSCMLRSVLSLPLRIVSFTGANWINPALEPIELACNSA